MNLTCSEARDQESRPSEVGRLWGDIGRLGSDSARFPMINSTQDLGRKITLLSIFHPTVPPQSIIIENMNDIVGKDRQFHLIAALKISCDATVEKDDFCLCHFGRDLGDFLWRGLYWRSHPARVEFGMIFFDLVLICP